MQSDFESCEPTPSVSRRSVFLSGKLHFAEKIKSWVLIPFNSFNGLEELKALKIFVVELQ